MQAITTRRVSEVRPGTSLTRFEVAHLRQDFEFYVKKTRENKNAKRSNTSPTREL